MARTSLQRTCTGSSPFQSDPCGYQVVSPSRFHLAQSLSRFFVAAASNKAGRTSYNLSFLGDADHTLRAVLFELNGGLGGGRAIRGDGDEDGGQSK
ncbi:hypothetical protein RISK_004194 [Rhodopirellula islandica]|uniref:Uncharacterized protein n=1 Tax=Rhodopirellula islandica TaxID=595434 RepID=A0A0J1BAS3_RHOIS|nr:hypothetical protein RISK_004194 [Rhodopirellula islandica]